MVIYVLYLLLLIIVNILLIILIYNSYEKKSFFSEYSSNLFSKINLIRERKWQEICIALIILISSLVIFIILKFFCDELSLIYSFLISFLCMVLFYFLYYFMSVVNNRIEKKREFIIIVCFVIFAVIFIFSFIYRENIKYNGFLMDHNGIRLDLNMGDYFYFSTITFFFIRVWRFNTCRDF